MFSKNYEILILFIIIFLVFLVLFLIQNWWMNKKIKQIFRQKTELYHYGKFYIKENYFVFYKKNILFTNKRINIYDFVNMIISPNRYEIENFLKNLHLNPNVFTKKKFKFFLINKKKKRNMILSFYNFNKKNITIDFVLIYHYGTKYRNLKTIPIIKTTEIKKFIRIFSKTNSLKLKKREKFFCYSISFKKFYQITEFKNSLIIESILLNIFMKFIFFFHLNLIYDESKKIFYFFKIQNKKITTKIIVILI